MERKRKRRRGRIVKKKCEQSRGEKVEMIKGGEEEEEERKEPSVEIRKLHPHKIFDHLISKMIIR